jgi:cytochrome c peroxidase
MSDKMSKWRSHAFILAPLLMFLLIVIGFSRADNPQLTAPIGPLPKTDAPNPELAELGKMLFFDPRLSGDGALSCATCHNPAKGWGDGIPLSTGYTGSLYFRNAKTILNAVHARYFYWDGRLTASDLDTQVRDSITETHFMNMDGRLMLERLKQVPEYVQMFEKTLNGEPSFGRTLKAIAAFEKTVVSKNAPFDQGNLSPEAQQGRKLFEGKAGCIQCHNGAYFSDGKPHNIGVPENPDVFKDPVRHITFRSMLKFLGVPNYMNLRQDPGYYVVSKNRKDRGKFITPTLREVERTAPYMHNGVFDTLDEVIEFYNRGGGNAPNKSPLLKPLWLSETEKVALITFLKSLSGDKIVVEPPELPEYKLIENWREVKN